MNISRWSFNSNEYAFFDASQCFYMYFETSKKNAFYILELMNVLYVL